MLNCPSSEAGAPPPMNAPPPLSDPTTAGGRSFPVLISTGFAALPSSLIWEEEPAFTSVPAPRCP